MILDRAKEHRHHRGYFDLHFHSNRNGGFISPKEIAFFIHHLYQKGKILQKVSLTDHDSLEGQQEFFDTIQTLEFKGKTPPPHIYFGTEVSLLLDYNEGVRVHLLAYKDVESSSLFHLRQIADPIFDRLHNVLHRGGINKAERLVDLIGDSGLVSMEDIYAHARFGKYVDDSSIVRALIASGQFRNEREAVLFMAGLGLNKPFDDNNLSPRAEDFLPDLARTFDYVALAHPLITASCEDLDGIICKLVNMRYGGINALEVYRPHNGNQVPMLESLAKKFGLSVTGGSDTHFFKEPYSLGIPLKLADNSRLI